MATQITNIPQEVQEQLDRTPDQRKAEMVVRRQARLDAMTVEQRQLLQDRIDRIDAVPMDKRHAFMQASRLGMVAGSIKAQVEEGLKFDDLLDSLDAVETEAVNWLVNQVTAARSK